MKLQLMTRRVSAAQSTQWIKQSAMLVRQYPVFIGITGLMYGIFFLVSSLGALSLLVPVLWPVLMAGYYQTVVDGLSAKQPNLATLITVFSQPRARNALLLLGAVRLLLMVPVVLLPTPVQLTEQMQIAAVDQTALLMWVAYFTVYTMLFAYSEPIVYFLGEGRIWPVLKASLDACWKNVLPLSFYAAQIIALMLAASFLLGIVSALSAAFGMLMALILMTVFAPVMLISFFLSFRDCFVLTPATAAAESSGTFEV